MSSIEEIRKNAESLIIDEDMKLICLKIIEKIQSSRDQSMKLTIGVISKWVGFGPSDKKVMRCAQLLSSRHDLKLFDLHFLLFDPDDPEDIGTEIEDTEVADAYRTGFLLHPDTDERIYEFEKQLAPYFTVSEELHREVPFSD